MNARSIRILLLVVVIQSAPYASYAQTLPQSTVDRQSIAQLQSQLAMPGISIEQQREIQLQISQLEYQINTRPPIVDPRSPGANQGSRQTYTPATIVPLDLCAADRSVVEYLQGAVKDPKVPQQERAVDAQRIRSLREDLRSRNC